jgi:hypothetical protein
MRLVSGAREKFGGGEFCFLSFFFFLLVVISIGCL